MTFDLKYLGPRWPSGYRAQLVNRRPSAIGVRFQVGELESYSQHVSGFLGILELSSTTKTVCHDMTFDVKSGIKPPYIYSSIKYSSIPFIYLTTYLSVSASLRPSIFLSIHIQKLNFQVFVTWEPSIKLLKS